MITNKHSGTCENVSQDLLNFDQTLSSPKIFPRGLLLISFFFLDFQRWALRLWFMEQKQWHVISLATHPPKCGDQTFGANPLNCWENVNQEHTCKKQNQFVNKWMCLTVRGIFWGKKNLIAWNTKQHFLNGFETLYEVWAADYWRASSSWKSVWLLQAPWI